MATDQPQTEGSPGTTLVRLSSLPSWSVEAAFWATLTLLTAAAGMARSRGLAPHTLWYDDLWVAALTRLPFWEATTTPTPVPPAFVAGSWILTRIVAGKELALQVIPFSASLLAIIVTGLLVRSATRSRAIGVLAAALAVFNPAMTHYAIFVKQYTSEYLFVALLLALVAREAQRDSEGVSWTLVICAAFACMVGFGTIVVAAVVVNVVFADSVWRASRRSTRRQDVRCGCGIQYRAARVLRGRTPGACRSRPRELLVPLLHSA